MSEIYAAQDANQFPALLAHYGNVGTSNGTSTPVKLAGNPDTGALYVDLIGTESIVIEVGTINVGTISVSSGSIAVTAGTVVATVGTVPGMGTVSNVGSVTSIGLLYGGTVVTSSGTITNSGTTTGVGSVSAIAQVHNAGTLQTILAGTITNSGTTTGVGTVAGIGVVSNITNGTVATNILPLGGVVLAGTVGVGTTATAIPTTPLASRKSLIVYNVGSTSVYIGGSGVTTLTGLPVGTADYSPSFDLGTTILYGITGTVGGTVNVLEVS